MSSKVFRIAKSFAAHLSDRDAIREQSRSPCNDALVRDRSRHRRGIHGLDPDHFDVRPQKLYVRGDPGCQTATAYRHENCFDRPWMLTRES